MPKSVWNKPRGPHQLEPKHRTYPVIVAIIGLTFTWVITASWLAVPAATADTATPNASSQLTVTVPSVSASATASDSVAPSASSSGAPVDTGTKKTTGGEEASEPAEPTISSSPATNAEEAKVDNSITTPGEPISVSFSGFVASEKVEVLLYSDPVDLGTINADDTGTVSYTFNIPDDLEAGEHTIQLTGWQSSKVAQAKIMVTGGTPSTELGAQGVPVWAWWVGGALGLVMLAFAALWVWIALIRGSSEPAQNASQEAR